MPQEQRAMTKQVPHLRWSQAPPLPWRRPGSADNLSFYNVLYFLLRLNELGFEVDGPQTGSATLSNSRVC